MIARSPPGELERPRAYRNYFFRGVGIELLSLLRYGQSPLEAPKSVVQESLWLALCGCCVHFLPVATSITMIYLNLSHMYVGFMTGSILSIAVNTALLQLAAKLQELLIVASLSNIVTHHIRKQLMFGDGVPLGTIGGGFMFSSLHFFWSPEFWGSLRASSIGRKQAHLYALLVISGLLAATVGPSSAILLIPRTQDWHAGSAQVFLSGSADELWPTTLSSSNLDSACTSPNGTDYAMCPSGGFTSLWSLGRTNFHLRNLGGSEWNISTNLLFAGTNVSISSSLEAVPSSQLFGNWRATALETAAQGPDLASAVMQRQIVRDWNEVATALPYNALRTSISEYKYHYSLAASSSTRIPVVRVACSEAQNISTPNEEVYFPTFPEFGCWNASLKTLAINSSSSTFTGLRATWIPLPTDFGSTSTGLMIQDSSTSLHPSKLAIGCSIDARWANGTTITPKSAPSYALVDKQTISPNVQCQYSAFRPSDRDSWTSISLDQDWLQVLSPPAPSQFQPRANQTVSTLEATLSNMGFLEELDNPLLTPTESWNAHIPGGFNRTVSLEWLLANFMADGLSRGAVANVLNVTGPPTSWQPLHYDKSANFADQLLSGGSPLIKPSEPAVEVQVSIIINGFAFLASSITDYLAISALLLHSLLALVHTAELIWTRRHSSCWDTITELLALAQKSLPAAQTLKNTGAGITQIRTFAKTAKVRAITDTNADEGEEARVELLFQDAAHEQGPQIGSSLLSSAAPPARSPLLLDADSSRQRKAWSTAAEAAGEEADADADEPREKKTEGAHSRVIVNTIRPGILYN